MAVAVYARYAYYFAFPNGKVKPAENFNVPVILGVQIMHLQRNLARFYGGLVHLELNAAADHHGGKLLLRSVRNAYGVYIFALADDRAVIRSGFYFL